MLFHGFYILNTEPLIVSYLGSNALLSIVSCVSHNRAFISQVRKGTETQYPLLPAWFRPKYILEHIGGWAEPWHRMARYKSKQTFHFLADREHHLIVNAHDENAARKQFLIRGSHFSNNIYINENLYKPLSEAKVYDAIYTAQLAPFKRVWLAKDIERLMVISYGGNLHAFCPELKHAEFNQAFLPRSEVVKKYNQSHAGLCLSAVEGAMFASCEYLLSGIPIVSTPSKGGRDEFFDDQNSIIVPPDAVAVAEAVTHWKNHPPDPFQIREATLKKMKPLRLDYCAYIATLIEKGGGGRKDPEALMERYFAPPDGMFSRFVKLDDLWKVSLEAFHFNS